MKSISKFTLAAVAAIGLVFGGAVAPASSASLPAASKSIIIVKSWPVIQKTTPAPGTYPYGLFHNGVKKRVLTNKCESGIARQGIYQSWNAYNRGWIKGPLMYVGVCEK
jgi:hypothetical protein